VSIPWDGCDGIDANQLVPPYERTDTSASLRIVVADDHRIVREGIQRRPARSLNLQHVTEVDKGKASNSPPS
jgi:hypothetical protein